MAVCVAYASGIYILKFRISKFSVAPVDLLLSSLSVFLWELQNDLVHGWGLDFALRRCVEVLTYVCLLLILLYYLFVSMHNHIGTSSSLKQPAHEKIGVVDSQWIIHQTFPSLGNQVNHLQKNFLLHFYLYKRFVMKRSMK